MLYLIKRQLCRWFNLVDVDELNTLIYSAKGHKKINTLRHRLKRLGRTEPSILENKECCGLFNDYDRLLQNIHVMAGDEPNSNTTITKPMYIDINRQVGQEHCKLANYFNYNSASIVENFLYCNTEDDRVSQISVGRYGWLPLLALAAFRLEKNWIVSRINRHINSHQHSEAILDWYASNECPIEEFVKSVKVKGINIDIIFNEIMRLAERCYPVTPRVLNSEILTGRSEYADSNDLKNLHDTVASMIGRALINSIDKLERKGFV